MSEARIAAPALLFRMGMERTGDPAAPLELRPVPALLHHGTLRAVALASATDVVGSLLSREGGGVERAFTTDLSLRVRPRRAPERIVARAGVLAAGRTVMTSETRFEGDGEAFALGQTTFKRVLLPDPSAESRPALPPRLHGEPLEVAPAQALGIEVVDAHSGALVLDPEEAIRNPNGSLQGTAVAMVVEECGLVFAEATSGAPRVVSELDLRFLAGGRAGPIRTRAESIDAPGTGEASMIRVELRDSDDRATAVALLRCESPPS